MSIEPGKTYRMRPQKVNGVYRDDRVFRVDEVLQDGLVVKGALDGENGWSYTASELMTHEEIK
jgi:hypothetical protein